MKVIDVLNQLEPCLAQESERRFCLTFSRRV